MSHLITIDCEMTGPKVTKHGLINLGVTLLDLSNGQTIDKLDLIINVPEGRVWDDSVRQWMMRHPKLAEVVEKVERGEGDTVQAAMQKFVAFLNKYYKLYNGDVVVGGDHIGEDSPWVNTYLSLCDMEPLHMCCGEIRHPVDICSYHQGCSRKTHKQVREFSTVSGKKFSANIAAFKHLNIRDRPSTEYTHRAIDDSENIAQGHYKVLKAIETVNEAYVPSSWMTAVVAERKERMSQTSATQPQYGMALLPCPDFWGYPAYPSLNSSSLPHQTSVSHSAKRTPTASLANHHDEGATHKHQPQEQQRASKVSPDRNSRWSTASPPFRPRAATQQPPLNVETTEADQQSAGSSSWTDRTHTLGQHLLSKPKTDNKT